jgi:hypothetical protein
VKHTVVRQVKALHIHCDKVGNVLLAKFACKDAPDYLVYIPASVVFWLADNLPTTPGLPTPPVMPTIYEDDWRAAAPRVLSVNCLLSNQGMRMAMKLDGKSDLTLLLDPSCIELLRQLLLAYRGDLLDVGL